MKKTLCLGLFLFIGVCWAQVDYEFESIPMDYEFVFDMPGRVMLFDGTEGSYDDEEAEIPLPFPFEFYGKQYNSLRVSTNGYLVFPDGESGVSVFNDSLPDAGDPNGIIAVFWDDLLVSDQEQGQTDQISYVIQGEAPNRVLIVDYTSVSFWEADTGLLWAQAKLYEGTNVIELHYGDSITGEGVTATIGLEHPCGCLAVRGPNYRKDNDVVPDEAYRYTPVPKYYIRSEINLNYEDLDGMPGRVMLFDGGGGFADNQETSIDLPFPFELYGVEYNSLRVSTNGYLVFPEDQNGDSYDNDDLPNPENPDGIIALFWDDLVVRFNVQGTEGPGQISYAVKGQTPNRELIIDYRAVEINPGGDPLYEVIFAQVKLYEGSHIIEFQYDDVWTYSFASATIGLEHPCGCIAEPGPNYNNNNDTVPNIGYRYVPYDDLIFEDSFGL